MSKNKRKSADLPIVSILERNRIRCSSCRADVLHSPFIKCTRCKNIVMCAECFSKGRETKKHKKTHPYRVGDNLNLPMTKDGWSANDCLLLLEAIEIFGLGNWTDIANHLFREEDDCRDHWNLLCSKEVFPKIDESLLFPASIKGMQEAQQKKDFIERKIEPAKETDSIAQRNKRKKASSTMEHAGYMRLRNDFDVEPDNDADLILADLHFTPEDDEDSRKKKQGLIQIYNQKLDHREEMKDFVVRRNKLDWKRITAAERKLTQDERNLRQDLAPIERFVPPELHEELIQGLLMEMRDIEKLRKLMDKYKANGGGNRIRESQGDEEYENRRPKGSRKRDREPSPPPAKGKENHLDDPDTVSQSERNFCSHIKLTLSKYLLTKDLLLREAAKLGYLTKSMAAKAVSLSAKKTEAIFDFFYESGWIQIVKPEREEPMDTS